MEKEPEVFKPIKGYEGYYEISSWGRVKSLARVWSVGIKKDTFLKFGKQREDNKYLHVTLCVDKVKKSINVHRLVAIHFCENPNNYEIVNHIDTDIFNNYYKNLEWTTYSGNTIHGFKYGRMRGFYGEKNGASKVKECDVRKIKMLYKSKISQKKIAVMYGVSQTCISKIILGTRWKHIL